MHKKKGIIKKSSCYKIETFLAKNLGTFVIKNTTFSTKKLETFSIKK